MFCLYVSLTISFLRAPSSLPTIPRGPCSIVSTFLNIRASYWSISSGFRLLGEIPAGAITMETKVGGIAHLGKKNGGGNKRRNIKLWSWREKKCLRRFYLEKNKKNANPCASVVQLKIRVSKQTYIFSLHWYVLPLVLWNARSGEFLKLFVHKGTQQLAYLVII